MDKAVTDFPIQAIIQSFLSLCYCVLVLLSIQHDYYCSNCMFNLLFYQYHDNLTLSQFHYKIILLNSIHTHYHILIPSLTHKTPKQTVISHFKQTLAFPSPYLPSFTALYKKNELSGVSSIQIEMHTRVYIQEMYKERASMYCGFGLHVKYSPIFVQTPCYTYNSHLFTVSY